ncbi:MAG: type VI secretion system contractile sheath large subunit [Deltaproteobacteria bacterium]|nr:type VI secretion system contractile sheath large subunit [Deltaproteobacteria bacterium]
MADRSRAGISAEFTLGKGRKPKSGVRPGTPFRMLVIGDFGGHRARGEVRPGSALRPRRVDVDSLASVLRKIAPRIPVAIGSEPPFTVAVQDMDGFHPDRLFATLDFFAPLRELRRQLQDGKAFARAAALLGKASEAVPAADVPAADPDDLLRLLGRAATPSAAPAGVGATVDSLIRQAVAPHIVGKPDPRQADLIAGLDGMCGELMRAVLHDEGFQCLEAAWRGLDRLVRALEMDENLQVFVLDASDQELAADFAAAPNLADAAMYRLIVDHGEPVPWSLLVACSPCGRRQHDASLLARLGTLAQAVDAAVLVGMDWTAWKDGFASLEDQRACTALRNSPTATAIAVAAPGILLRLPYGNATEPIESFAFAEQSSPPAAERYLWGSASLAVAELLARSYVGAGGWDFVPGDESSISDLPIHVFARDGESAETPASQVWLRDSEVDQMIKEGLMPIVSVRGRGEVSVPRFQSIASPPAGLAGRWRND